MLRNMWVANSPTYIVLIARSDQFLSYAFSLFLHYVLLFSALLCLATYFGVTLLPLSIVALHLRGAHPDSSTEVSLRSGRYLCEPADSFAQEWSQE